MCKINVVSLRHNKMKRQDFTEKYEINYAGRSTNNPSANGQIKTYNGFVSRGRDINYDRMQS